MSSGATIDSLLATGPDSGRPALTIGADALTYSELDGAVERLSGALARMPGGIEGLRVAIIAPNVPALIVGMFAAWRAGAVAVPLNARLREFDLGRILDDAEVSVVVTLESHRGFSFKGLLEALTPRLGSLRRTLIVDQMGSVTRELDHGEKESYPVPLERSIAAILYTSGTTGMPKGALVKHSAQLNGARELSQVLGLGPEDGCAFAIPISHAFGLICLLACMESRSHAVLIDSTVSLDPLIAAVTDNRATIMHGSPALFASFLKARPDGLPSLRSGLTAGSHCPPQLLERLEQSGTTILNCWGMTEISAATSCRGSDSPAVRHATVGRALAGYELRTVRIDDWDETQKEVQVRGPYVTPGYHGRPAETSAAFDGEWLRTGDLGSLDEQGNLTIAGRAKEVVQVAGFNVFPAEVESFLLTHPDVDQVAVVGVEHERFGEALQAIVVARPGSELSSADLVRFARERLAGYKIPYAIDFRAELPLLGSGKPDRIALAQSSRMEKVGARG